MYTVNSIQLNKKKTCTQLQDNITAPGIRLPVIFQLEISTYVG